MNAIDNEKACLAALRAAEERLTQEAFLCRDMNALTWKAAFKAWEAARDTYYAARGW